MTEPIDVDVDPQDDNTQDIDPVEQIVDPPEGADVDPVDGQTTDVTPKEFDPVQYIDNLDLPDDQKEALRSGFLRQDDYTRKTQDIAQKRKIFEQWQPVIERIAYNPDLYKQVMGEQNVQQQKPKDEDLPQDPKEYAQYVKNQAVEEAMERMRNETSQNADYQQAETLDTRLQSIKPEDKTFQRIIAGMIAQDSEYIRGQKTATQATKEALDSYNQYLGTVRKQTQDDINLKVQNKRHVAPNRTSNANTSQAQPANIWEAYEQALAEMEGE